MPLWLFNWSQNVKLTTGHKTVLETRVEECGKNRHLRPVNRGLCLFVPGRLNKVSHDICFLAIIARALVGIF